jgi:hypothetical protein
MRSVLVAAGSCALALVIAQGCSSTPASDSATGGAAGVSGGSVAAGVGGTRPLPDGGAGLGGRGSGGALVVIEGGGGGSSGEAGAPAVCEREASCAGYCDNQSQPRECTDPAGLELCIDYCENRIEQYLPETCLDEWLAYLGCVACAEFSCEPRCSGLVCEDPPFILGCDGLWEDVRDCAGPCLLTGSTSGFESPDQSSSYETSSCECPIELRTGGAHGEPCVDNGDCAEVCCACSASDGRYVASHCRSGQCVGAPEICEVAEDDLSISMFCAGEGGL